MPQPLFDWIVTRSPLIPRGPLRLALTKRETLIDLIPELLGNITGDLFKFGVREMVKSFLRGH